MSQLNTLAAALVVSLSTKSTNEELVAALQLSTVRASARAVLVDLCATMTGAARVAECLTAYAALNPNELKTYAKAKAEGRKVQTPECVSIYVQLRREVDERGLAFTVAKRGGSDNPCYIPTEREASAKKSVAAKGPRASRKVTEPKGDLTDAQAMKQIRALLHLNSTSNADTVAALQQMFANVAGKRISQPAKRAA